MKKSYWIESSILIAFVSGLLMVNLLTGDRLFSPVENRNLAQKPAFSWEKVFSGGFMKEFEEYITDQFAGRDGWTALKAYAERAMGKKENNGIYICGDTLIERFDSLDEKQLTANLQAVDRFIENTGIETTLMLIPSAAEILRDKLPEGAPNADQTEILSCLSGRTKAKVADVCAALSAHKEEYIYYRTDHHWTSLGACYGADVLLRSMGMEGVTPDRWNPQTVSREFFGTLWSSSGARYISPDSMEVYVQDEGIEVLGFENGSWKEGRLYDLEKLGTKDKYSMFLGGNQPLAVIRTGHEGEKLLIVRDSYADCMAPFLTEAFSEIHLVDLRYYRMSLTEYVQENGIGRAAVVYSLKNFAADRNVYFLGN